MSQKEEWRIDLLNHIHTEDCYVMYPENRGGLAKIIRALKPYHTQDVTGNPHEICKAREILQDLRFQVL